MALDVSALTDYTWAEIALAAKTAMMTAALGGNTLSIKGRTIGRISIKEATDLYNMAIEQQQNEEAGGAGLGNVLVRLDRA